MCSQTRGAYGLHKGKHLLIDCSGVPRELCLDDQRLLEAMARAATECGATVISQIRYRFGSDSPPGCTAIVMLDESHCSVHTYADLGLMALDVFTCGNTNPEDVWAKLAQELSLTDAQVKMVERFTPTEVLEW
nr:adenosylmethionine decarboxylase [Candidatus Krumholzibacteria bacterium]